MATEPDPKLDFAHVLYVDLVGYSKLLMEQQASLIRELQEIVQATPAYQQASQSDDLIGLPTGDGMALAFFGSPTAPAECAAEIAQAVRGRPHISLRMGIHSGGVYHVSDINANLNVSGGGINIAQRVMDCGDDGHILISRTVAELLAQLTRWTAHLTDLGDVEVKHGVRVHLYNLHSDAFGNATTPAKLADGATRALDDAPAPPVGSQASKLMAVARAAEATATPTVSATPPGGAVSIAGLSAGATLALLHAERSDEPPASVISGFGIYDFEQLRGAGASLLRRAALRTGDRDLWRRHSVADSPTFAGPVLLLHGTHDTLVPMCQHQRLVQSRQAAGLPVEERIFEGACHGFFNDAESDAAQGATREIHRFLSSLPLGRSWCA